MTKPTPQELIDEKERSTAVGFFNFAEAYFIAANALRKSNAKAGHIESPIRFLYYQAIELYLKAHLRAHDIHPLDLRTRYAHDVGKLSRKSKDLGLSFTDEDDEIIRLMEETDAVIRSRYISTGFARWPDIDSLDRTCLSLRTSVAKELRAKGHTIFLLGIS